MHRVVKFLCFYLSLLIHIEARVEWYVGVSGQQNIIHDCIVLGEEGYWEKVLVNHYKPALEDYFNGTKFGKGSGGVETWKSGGRPIDMFKLSLQKQIQAEIYKGNSVFKQILFTVGAYVYRRDHVLVSFEVSGGRLFNQLTTQKKTILFRDNIPQKLRDIKPEESSPPDSNAELNPFDTGRPYQYCDGEISLDQDITLGRTLSFGSLMRVGSIIRKRVYGFVCLGVDASKMNIQVNETKIEGENSLALIVSKTTYGSSPEPWEKSPLLVGSSLKDKLMSFNSSEFAFGFVGGLGGEFYMTRRASIRFQTTYTYWPSVEFTSNLGTHLKCSPNSWGFNLGMFFRF